MTEGNNIKIFVRCRPLKGDESPANINLDSHRQTVSVESQNKEFVFDRVFDSGTPQEDVYESVVKPLIPQVLQGYNCAILAYGQTGTGKTYTMEGNQDGIGLIPRSVLHIFESVRRSTPHFTINVSFLELYSEDAYDLLSPPEDTSKLRIFDDKKRSVKVEGLREIAVETESDIMELLARGSHKRQTAATLLNESSSRSHSIFTITVTIKTEIQEDREIMRVGKLNLVDLAGSESIARSGAHNKHAREAGNINQSLLTLTRVITALAEKRPHVPYRESKLTRILQDSLGGATRTSMIATISPANADLINTLGTLEYALRARCITNRPECNRHLTNRKTSEDQEEYRKYLESEIEARIRDQVIIEFRSERAKLEAQYRKDLEEKSTLIRSLTQEKTDLKDDVESKTSQILSLTQEKTVLKERFEENSTQVHSFAQERTQLKQEIEEKSALIESLTREKMELATGIEEKSAEIEDLTQENAELNKELKIMKFMVKDKEELIEALRLSFKKREEQLELELKKHADQQESQTKTVEKLIEIDTKEEPAPKRIPKMSKRAAIPDDDYANMTFTGDDEIVQVSAIKKPRRAIAAEPKQRQDLTLSGKKKKLINYGGDIDLSPISPPVMLTRSRNARRKLKY